MERLALWREEIVVPKGNQFSGGPPRKPFKRGDEVTANLIFLCLLYVVLGSAALIGLIKWVAP